MIRVALCTPDRTLVERLRQAIGDSFEHIVSERLPQTAQQLLDELQGAGHPDIVVLDAGPGLEDALVLTRDLAAQEGVNVVLVSTDVESLAFEALRAGARDLVPAQAGPGELRAALDRAAALVVRTAPAEGGTGTAASGQAGHVLTVTSPKGGVGKTTVATNLAVGLAQRFPQQVVLVDLDVHFGDVGSALNLTAQHTLPEIARGPAARDSIAVKSFLTLHSTGLYVVPGSDSPAAADSVTAADVADLLEQLRQMFAYVVVDTAPGLTEHTLAALDHTDSLVLVTSLDVPGVRGLRRELDTLAQLKLVPSRRFIVLNFHDHSRGLTIDDVEATIRAKVDLVLPQSKVVPLSTNQGVPLVQGNGRDPVTRQLRALIPALGFGGEPPKPGLFSFSRRRK